MRGAEQRLAAAATFGSKAARPDRVPSGALEGTQPTLRQSPPASASEIRQGQATRVENRYDDDRAKVVDDCWSDLVSIRKFQNFEKPGVSR